MCTFNFLKEFFKKKIFTKNFNFFGIFFRVIGGTLWFQNDFEEKYEIFFFSNFFPDIKMYTQTMNKNNFRIFLPQLVSPQ